MMSRRFETFSFLPPLSPAQAQAQATALLNQGYVPMIEYAEAHSTGEVYWQMWPIVSPQSNGSHAKAEEVNASLLMMQIDSCARRNPYSFIRLSGYDTNRKTNATSFVVRTPAEGV